jgi:tRNA-dihydrouridine synthase
MHGRTARQMFRGRADWDRIAELAAALRIPVLGNGDVETAGDAVERLRASGCAGVLIGRASMKNPWIYRQASALLAGRLPAEPTLAERRASILLHFDLVADEEDPKTALHKLRTFTGWYTQGLPEGRRLRSRIQDFRSVEEIRDAVVRFFDDLPRAA